MALLDPVRRLLALRRTTDDKPGRQAWFWFGRYRHRRVSTDHAMTMAAVWACLRFLTGNIGQLPWGVVKYTDKGRINQRDHPVYWLLSVRANPELSAFNFRQLMLYRALLLGHGFAEIERDAANRPVALWPIDNDRVTLDRRDNGELFYRITNSEGYVDIESKDMFDLVGMSDDGINGMGVIAYAARSFHLGISQEEYGAAFFDNSGIPSSVLEHPKRLSDGAMTRLKKQWDENYSGPSKSQQTLILEEGLQYKAIGLPPEQAQFLASRSFTLEDVARWFGVPPQKIGHLVHSNYNSVEHLSIEVIVDTLTPWVIRFEQEANYKLLSNSWGGLATKMDLRSLMRGTHQDRAAYYRAMFGIGSLSINEIREKEDLNPITGGDTHMIPLNMAPLDMVVNGELLAPQKQAPNPPEPTGATQQRLLSLLEATLNEMEEFGPARTYVIEPHDDLPN